MLSTEPDAPVGMDQTAFARESLQRFEKLKTDLVAGLEAEPGVDDVTVANAVPGGEPGARIAIDGAVPQSGAPIARYNYVATDFFEAFDARVISGRGLRDSDGVSSAPAVIVNSAFVTQLLGGANAVGRRVRYVERLAARRRCRGGRCAGIDARRGQRGRAARRLRPRAAADRRCGHGRRWTAGDDRAGPAKPSHPTDRRPPR